MNEIAIIKQENIAQIVGLAPQSYQDNKLSQEKCVEAGQKILSIVEQNGGQMTDALDQQAAVFIEKAKKTVKKMNERRSPVTKLFDEVRANFTMIENNIDPTKANTIPYKLQQYRNTYATQKRAAEEERQRKIFSEQQVTQARERLAIDIENDLNAQFTAVLNKSLNYLQGVDNSITLENYPKYADIVQRYCTDLDINWQKNLRAEVRVPLNVKIEDAQSIEQNLIQKLVPGFKVKFNTEVAGLRVAILDRLPSKKANLERIAQSSKEEAERLKAEMEAKDREEAAHKEEERAKREEEEKQAAEMKKQTAEMNSLFAGQAAKAEYQSKAKVTKKINLLNAEGIMPIISMWWSKEGCTLTVEELAKIFKKQIAFCEKLAKEGTMIQDESIEYVDEVKAK